MKIVVFSDLHIFKYPSHWSGLFDKRAIGILNRFFFKKKLRNVDNLNPLIDKINNIKPDLVIFNGDLTTVGEKLEFRVCREIFKPIVESKLFDFYCIPGNHDFYVNNKECHKECIDTFFYLNKGRDLTSHNPYFMILKGINFCFINECYPVSIFFSNGYIDNYSKSKILDWSSSYNKIPKILVGHYPLMNNHNYKFWRNLVGYNDILKLLDKGYIDLSICGHAHKFTEKIDHKGRGEISVGSIAIENKFSLIHYDYFNDIFKHEIVEF